MSQTIGSSSTTTTTAWTMHAMTRLVSIQRSGAKSQTPRRSKIINDRPASNYAPLYSEGMVSELHMHFSVCTATLFEDRKRPFCRPKGCDPFMVAEHQIGVSSSL